MSQILRDTPATLQLTVYNDGVPADLDANPTLVVTNGNGDTVTSGGVTKPGSTTGIYRSVLPAQTTLAVLTATWTGLLAGAPLALHQHYEIVGDVLFTEADARTAQIVGGQAALADENTYPDELLSGWRDTITELFEQRMKRPVIQRYARVAFTGGGGHLLDLSYGFPQTSTGTPMNRPGRTWDVSRIISATIDGTAQTVGDLTLAGYKLYHTNGTWTRGSESNVGNVVVEYEYGPDPVWAEAHQRGLDLLLANAAPKSFPSSATSISTEDGTFRITTFPAAVEDFLSQHTLRKGFGFA